MDETINSAQRKVRAHLAANVKALRGKQGVSQEALASRAGLHRTYISQVEREIVNVSLDNLVLLACALGVTVGELFVESREPVVSLKPGRKRSVSTVK
ncbi:helix-turn-helix transcriptional regulator [Cupriavidus necator]|uniref:XRE family transcriptional regulator n=1 Tax=Cupriavidus necator TaxID=106590 RepID=A0A367PAW0_CUPNE|nr:helix-turn-helix transcriptional regulator [Cupriavidus necator]QQX84435.1 helix-turn-helix transcriptional regulator [Cupriavidus necator]RCJ04367.1 XRE family transcriptional regulator [Cupriavidus necator]